MKNSRSYLKQEQLGSRNKDFKHDKVSFVTTMFRRHGKHHIIGGKTRPQIATMDL